MRADVVVVAAVVGLRVLAAIPGSAADERPTIYRPVPASPQEMDRGPQLRALDFDAREVDFEAWVKDFEQKVHHSWIVPTYRGYGGRVDFELVVEENGTITTLEVLESHASVALVKAAREAFSRARLLPLPDEYDRLRVRMRVTCVYGPPPGE